MCLTLARCGAKLRLSHRKGTPEMFERFVNRSNTASDSCAAANESACASSARAMNHCALLLTMDTALAVSIFAALELIIIRLCSIILIFRAAPTRPYLAPAR